MKRNWIDLAMITKRLLLLLFMSPHFMGNAQDNVHCIIKTSLGNIQLELEAAKAPVTVENFLLYVNGDLYRNTSFFRVCTPENEAGRKIQIEVIQGGDVPENKQLPPIPMESTATTGLIHKNGTISMAREGPDSATSSFFICINDQPELDFGGKRNPDGQGFAAFGQVTKGMDVVKKIQARETKGQLLASPVTIYNIVLTNTP